MIELYEYTDPLGNFNYNSEWMDLCWFSLPPAGQNLIRTFATYDKSEYRACELNFSVMND
jgi:hypothetical protein